MRPPLWERQLAIVTMVALAFGLPDQWLRATSETSAVNRGGDLLTTLVFAGLFLAGTAILATMPGRLRTLLDISVPIVVFTAFAAVSALWAEDVGTSVRRAVAFVLATTFAYYLAARFNFDDVIAMLGAAMAIGLVLSLVLVVAVPRAGLQGDAWSGVFANKNTLGRTGVVGFLVHLSLVNIRPRFRTFYAALLLVDLALVIGSRSTTSFIALLAMALLPLVYRAFRARKTLYGAVVVSMLTFSVFAVLGATANLGPITRALGRDVTFTGRTRLWRAVWDEITTELWFGYGFEGFWGGWFSPNHEVWIELQFFLPGHAHNGLLEMLLTFGLAGTVLFTIMFWRAIADSIDFLRKTPGALGRFPLLALTLLTLLSLSERGIVGRSILWLIFVVVALAARSARSTSLPNETSASPDLASAPPPPQLTLR